MSERTSVLVVEDSPTQAAHLKRLLEADGDIDVVAIATSRAEAIDGVLRTRPQVVTMDLEIPGTLPGDELAGIRAIRTIMAVAPLPIIVVSRHVRDGESPAAIDSLAAGAAEVHTRPQESGGPSGEHLRERIRALSQVTVKTRHTAASSVRRIDAVSPIVALGASTGGPAAMASVISELRGIRAPMLVVQHIHPEFVASFASWLSRATAVPVQVASDGQEPAAGHAYVAPPRQHLRVTRQGRLHVGPDPEAVYRPSVDELFHSLAQSAPTSTVAAVLTGIGEDGARGLAEIREAGGVTLAQDRDTSAVYAMPAMAAHLDGGHDVLPLERIGPSIRLAVGGAAA